MSLIGPVTWSMYSINGNSYYKFVYLSLPLKSLQYSCRGKSNTLKDEPTVDSRELLSAKIKEKFSQYVFTEHIV